MYPPVCHSGEVKNPFKGAGRAAAALAGGRSSEEMYGVKRMISQYDMGNKIVCIISITHCSTHQKTAYDKLQLQMHS